MERDIAITSVVLAGPWNAPIFQAEWVHSKLLGEAGTAPDVQVSLLPTGTTVIEILPCRTVALRLVPGRLEVRPLMDHENVLGDLEDIACRVLEVLPETPVVAIGINFGSSTERFSKAPLIQFRDSTVFSSADFHQVAVDATRVYRKGNVELRVRMHSSGERLHVEFNRNIAVSGNARAAVELLRRQVAVTHQMVCDLEQQLESL
jgi:hypothetical protein